MAAESELGETVGTPRKGKKSIEQVSAELKAAVEPDVKPRVSKHEAWNPADFQKDAAYFAVNFGLPNAGLNPLKLSDIPESMLAKYFGEKSRNGYKLNNIVGLPIQDILELSQVVDGYDKPINGVLSHSFVKGVYAERVQHKEVNWASYASGKLRGQITQWEHMKKGMPDGPPCIRKPRVYKPPVPNLRDSTTKKSVAAQKSKQLDNAAEPLLDEASLSLVEALSSINVEAEKSGKEDVAPLKEYLFKLRSGSSSLADKQVPNLLLSMVKHSISSTAASERKVLADISKIKATLEVHKSAADDMPTLRLELDEQVEKAEAELADVRKEKASTEEEIEILEVDIELEQNKEENDTDSDVGSGYFLVLEDRLKQIQKVALDLISREDTIEKEMETLKILSSTREKKFLEIPKKEARASSVLAALEEDLKSLQVIGDAQREELLTLSTVLQAPCPTLVPRFVPTSTHIVGTEISVTNCPVCCNGYHCYNWIPASCGHAYHASCLFPLIGAAITPPKCYACGETFSPDWLRSWGLDIPGTDDVSREYKSYVDELRDVYGKHGCRLAHRRELAIHLQTTQERVDGTIESELRDISTPEGTSVIDLVTGDVQHGSSKSMKGRLLTPKLENVSPSKKRRQSEPEIEAARKVKNRPFSSAELCTPFSPLFLSQALFRQLLDHMLIKSCRSASNIASTEWFSEAWEEADKGNTWSYCLISKTRSRITPFG